MTDGFKELRSLITNIVLISLLDKRGIAQMTLLPVSLNSTLLVKSTSILLIRSQKSIKPRGDLNELF